MNNDNFIRESIDDSLGSVRFNANDMRAVLGAVRSGSSPRSAHRAKKRRKRFERMFALMTAALVIVPVAVFAMRALHTPITDISALPYAASGEQTSPQSDQEPLPSAMLSESDAIRIARACFEENCGTEVFAFEEYTVNVQTSFAYGSDPSDACMEVTLLSIYDNGCSFRVRIDHKSGAVLSFSDPAAAIRPGPLRTDSREVQAWFEKYGADRNAWPEEAQAEFARRYEGVASK